MGKWTRKDLVNQYRRAKERGWLPAFAEAAAIADEPIEVMLGVGSRETNMQNIVGDGGHGHGVMQIDDRSFRAWTSSGAWRDARKAIVKGGEVLKSKKDQIIGSRGRLVTIRSSRGDATFRGADFTPADLQRIGLAAYNSGLWAYRHFSVSRNPDAGTTGRDYSADVLRRAAVFAELMKDDADVPVRLARPSAPVAAATNDIAPAIAKVTSAVTVAATGGAVATSDTAGLSTIAIVLLVVAGLAILVLLGVAVWWFFIRGRLGR